MNDNIDEKIGEMLARHVGPLVELLHHRLDSLIESQKKQAEQLDDLGTTLIQGLIRIEQKIATMNSNLEVRQRTWNIPEQKTRQNSDPNPGSDLSGTAPPQSERKKDKKTRKQT